MGEMKKLEKHEARVQFYAVEAEVLDLIRKGYGYTMIYRRLHQEGKITMSYVTFYGYVSRRINKKEGGKKKNQLQKIEQLSPPHQAGRVFFRGGDPVNHMTGEAIEGREHDLLAYFAAIKEPVPEKLWAAVRKAHPDWTP